MFPIKKNVVTTKIIKIILCALFTHVFPVSDALAQQPAKPSKNVYKDIGNHYLPVFNIALQQSGLELEVEEEEEDEKKVDLRLTPLSPGEQRKIALAILSEQSDKRLRNHTKIFDEDFWKDLELFCGPVKARKKHLAQTWKKTITTMGDVVSKRLLVRTTTNTEVLKRRQNAIKLLRTNKKLASRLTRNLKTFAKQEPILYSFWKPELRANKDAIKNLYFREGLFNAGLNSNPAALGVATRLRNFLTITAVLSPILPFWIGYSADHYYMNDNTSMLYSLFNGGPKDLWHDLKEEWNDITTREGPSENLHTQELRIQRNSKRKLKCFVYAVFGGLWALGSWQLLSLEKKNIDLTNYIQTKMIAVSGCIRAVYSAYERAVKHKELRAAIPTLKHIDKLAHTTQELSEFIPMIQTGTFKGKASFFSSAGRVLAANTLMSKIKHHLVKSLEALGELDAYLSMANLLDHFEEKEAKFSFVSYVENAKKPHLNVQDFWFPQLLNDNSIAEGKHPIVTNSLKMDAQSDGTRNIILTGPNTAGKSTIIKSLVTCLLLAQSYGIAPAQSMEFTPFKRIQTYINIPDNASEGISLFKAELLRVAHLLNHIQSLAPNEFSFTILDEIFSGTSPEEAIVGSGNVMDSLANIPNSMNIIATHYGLLTRVEEYTGGIFKNYKVTVDQLPDGKYVFPYTIQRGRSDQHIALGLIKQEGCLSDNGTFNLAQLLADDIAVNGIR